jgi:tetraacyldisaccharide 4'-kinase
MLLRPVISFGERTSEQKTGLENTWNYTMTPFEFLYFLGYSVKKRYAVKYQKRLPCKVISVGNITLGGTGKTPAAMALAKKAASMGFHPCILTRGYKGKAEGPCFVGMGDGALIDASQAGDEAMLMAETLPGVPIVKGKNRYKAGMFAISKLKSPPLFILDDGFQHWSLHRDTDILLINGKNPFGNGRLLPLGPLREPLSAMERADMVVITNTGDSSPDQEEVGIGRNAGSQQADVRSLTETIRKYAASAQIYFARHLPAVFIAPSGNVFAIPDMKDKKVFAFCGIGNPESFKSTMLSLVGEFKGLMVFRDHYRYSHTDFRRITEDAQKSGADWIVTTEKDIMRLTEFPLPDNLLALRIEFQIDNRFYEEVFRGG